MLGLRTPRADAEGLVEEAPGVVKRPKPSRLRPAADARSKCSHCKTALAQAVIGNEKRCSACIDELLVKRLVSVLKVHHALSHGDAVLAAVSGGPSSMALADLLERVHARNWDRMERGEVMFRLHLAHVNMAAAFPPPHREQLDAHAARVLSHLRSRHGPDAVKSLRIEDVYADGGDASARAETLQRLLASVGDGTSRQDLLAGLRRQLLQRTACELGCNKLLLGDSASQLASGFLAALSKGQGFSAPADLQLADAREGPGACCVVRPLRHISRKELALHAHFRQLPFRATPRLQDARRATVNSLCDAFVADLHVANAGALSTVMKTACKLQPFEFNDITLAAPPPLGEEVPYVSQRHAAQRQEKAAHARERAEAVAARSTLCELCRAPLNPARKSSSADAACGGAGAVDAGGTTLTGCAEANGGDCAETHRVQRLCRSCQALHADGIVSDGGGCAAHPAFELLPAALLRRGNCASGDPGTGATR